MLLFKHRLLTNLYQILTCFYFQWDFLKRRSIFIKIRFLISSAKNIDRIGLAIHLFIGEFFFEFALFIDGTRKELDDKK